MPLGTRRYHPWDTESQESGLEPPQCQSNVMSMLLAFTCVLIASDLECGLNLPTIWWKTHVEDTNSVQWVTFWVGDDTWTMYVKIEAENVWICKGGRHLLMRMSFVLAQLVSSKCSCGPQPHLVSLYPV
ncbi:putative B3 domain-containing protein isoform X2 [Salvia divinorum]|uniref:B3 domain-containing protein isoform X2 n=1 Tax=Salvia divinorum TaxID=28513 RepID=A0ABD1GPD1_SALDI